MYLKCLNLLLAFETVMQILLSFFVLICPLVVKTLGDIRCFCNLSICVKSSYMCKSTGPEASCFSHFGLHYNNHGCIELIKPGYHCSLSSSSSSSSSSSLLSSSLSLPSKAVSTFSHDSILSKKLNASQTLCCKEDMCNYVKNLHFSGVNKKRENENDKDYSSSAIMSKNLAKIWWYKVTLSLVTLIGTLILIVLGILAAQLLRQESERKKHLKEIERQKRFKTSLLVDKSYRHLYANCFNHHQILTAPPKLANSDKSIYSFKSDHMLIKNDFNCV